MDRSAFSFIMEILKTMTGFFIVFNYPEALSIYEGVYISSDIIYGYFITSISINLYYQFIFFKEKNELLIVN